MTMTRASHVSERAGRALSGHELRMLALVGVVGAAVVAAAGWFGLSYVGVVTTDATATARLQTLGDTLGLGSDVKYHGLIVGRVRETSSADGAKSASIIIEDDKIDAIPANVTARVLPGTLFGGEYVDLVEPRRPAATPLRAGAVIPADSSAETIRMMDLFETSQRILSAIDPAQLDAAVSGLARALDGRGDELGSFAVRADRYLGVLAEHEETFYEDLDLLATTLESTSDAEPYLVSALESSVVTARTVVEQREDIAALLGQATRSTRTAHGVLQDNEEHLIRLVGTVSPVLQTWAERRDRLEAVLEWMPAVLNNGASGIGEHGIKIDGYIEWESPEPYTSADCPRYPGLAGSNCPDGSSRSSDAGYGGSSGTVGSPAERALVAELFGIDPEDEGLVAAYALLSGPVLRGQEVRR